MLPLISYQLVTEVIRVNLYNRLLQLQTRDTIIRNENKVPVNKSRWQL